MIAKKEVIAWLSHRAGVEKIEEMPCRFRRKALELNVRGREFVDAFGQREIKGFVGFVDLAGFSERVKGWKNQEISEYLKRFLAGIGKIVFDQYGLVDKTIGDEIMFVLPDMEEDQGPPGILFMNYLLCGICKLQRELGTLYPFRFGLAYGYLYIDLVDINGYSEWTTVGEVVHLAKRLCNLPELATDFSIGGAFGVLIREVDDVDQFKAILDFIVSFSSMTYRLNEKPVSTLKGVSPARYALLLPKT